jgi:hypothetical protein
VVEIEALFHQVQTVEVLVRPALLKLEEYDGTASMIMYVFNWHPHIRLLYQPPRELLFLFSVTLMFIYKHNDRDMGINLRPSAFVAV